MNDINLPSDSLTDEYSRIYTSLSELRESFHRSGRLDDSNAKLDEVSKLFATYLAFKNGQIPTFPTPHSVDLVTELQAAFAATVRLRQYQHCDGSSIFGSQPALILRSGDELLASDLIQLVRGCIDLAFSLRSDERSFDILNEAFGHFVRDNFRSNIEDAQYMTPPEVVDFMVDMVLEDVATEDPAAHDTSKHWTFLDPSCGVGSFLAAIYHRARNSGWLDPQRIRLFGQDKVERMVRLSTINLNLFNVEEHRITVGNSLELGSPLDILNDTVDIIVTNPPFGARFNQGHVAANCGNNTPFFSAAHRAAPNIDSELLFVDRNLRLLRDGGRLLIVVPDGVVSAKGTAALLRQHLANSATLRAVIELPATTFAQAGTRTKTAILYVQKGRTSKSMSAFMAVSKDIGFQVSSRKGTQVKVAEGNNELPKILAAYQKWKRNSGKKPPQVLCAKPSCVVVPESIVLKGSWTPSHYSATRFETVDVMRKNRDFDLVPLRDLVEFCAGSRKPEVWTEGWAFISVLHILGEGFVDVRGALNYAPKTPGLRTNPGELLVSKINPRIPRVCVTPNFGVKTLCSSEFEVMKIKADINTYTLAYLLQTDTVQNQICSLTSGTSASHNRIRTAELSQVLVPVAKNGTQKADLVRKLAVEYQKSLMSLTQSSIMLAGIRKRDTEIFSA